MMLLLLACTHRLPTVDELDVELLSRFDLDHDGVLTEREYRRWDHSPGAFRTLDADHDEKITAKELGDWLRRTSPAGSGPPMKAPNR
jgi:Ca2+-binding EF-hand superfamily protein